MTFRSSRGKERRCESADHDTTSLGLAILGTQSTEIENDREVLERDKGSEMMNKAEAEVDVFNRPRQPQRAIKPTVPSGHGQIPSISQHGQAEAINRMVVAVIGN